MTKTLGGPSQLWRTALTWAQAITYVHVLAILYLVIAVAIAVGVGVDVFAWLYRSFPFVQDIFAASFAIGALILMNKPSDKQFALALAPLSGFIGVGLYYTYALQHSTSIISLYYFLAILLIPLAYRFASKRGVRLHHVYMVVMMLIGMGITASPESSGLRWITARYGIPGEAVGLSLIVLAGAMAVFSQPNTFIVVGTAMLFYVANTISLTWNQDSLISSLIGGTLLVSILFTLVRAGDYFKPMTEDEKLTEKANAFLERSRP